MKNINRVIGSCLLLSGLLLSFCSQSIYSQTSHQIIRTALQKTENPSWELTRLEGEKMDEKHKPSYWLVSIIIWIVIIALLTVYLFRDSISENPDSIENNREPILGINQAGNGVAESIDQLKNLLTQLDDRISDLDGAAVRAENAAAEIRRGNLLIEESALRIETGISGIEDSAGDIGVTANSIQGIGEQIREQVQTIGKEFDIVETDKPGSVNPGSGGRDNL